MTAAPSSADQDLAEACARAMWEDDDASRHLGVALDSVAPGAAVLSMTVTKAMTNGHGTCHGGYIFTLADSAFAFACNTYDLRCVAQHCSIAFVAPAYEGERLIATAREVQRYGRNGIYDVRVTNPKGEPVAEFRGQSRTVGGALVAPAADPNAGGREED